MWTYIPEYLRYIWCYIRIGWVLTVGQWTKPNKPSVSSDTKRDVPEQQIFKDPEGRN